MYLHKKSERTVPQQKGIDFHRRLEIEINTNRRVQIGRTKIEFEAPDCEQKVYIPYNEFVTLSAVFDCVDGDTLYEWKTGKTSPYDLANGLQIPFYFFCLERLNKHVKRAYLVHWDFDTEVSSLIPVINSKKKLEMGENLVETLSMEIWEHFNKLGIL